MNPKSSEPSWAALRACWSELKIPEMLVGPDPDSQRALRQRHTAALDALVAAGELEAAVAGELNMAFEQSVSHMERSAGMCYIAMPAESWPRGDLMEQKAALEEMAVKSDVQPDTVARARAALERDITWLGRFQAGETPGSLGEIEVSPTAAGAARALVELLLNAKV
jgi:hypothetical protein